MRLNKKLIIVAVLMASADLAFAQLNFGYERTPPHNDGALTVEEFGPVLAHPIPEDGPSKAPVSPKLAEKKEPTKNDIQSLFQEDKPKAEEKNPLEEQAKNELKVLEDPESSKPQEQMVQSDQNKQSDITIKAENAPKEIELDSASLDNKSLPTILR